MSSSRTAVLLPETAKTTAAAKAICGTIFDAIALSAAVLIATLKEVFDESAYQRFLDGRRLQSSPEAYAMFQQENELAKSRRPRCC
jgi:hypothetical protein